MSMTNSTVSRVLLEKLMVTHLVKKFPEDSLPCSQVPATGTYPEPDESCAQIPTMFP